MNRIFCEDKYLSRSISDLFTEFIFSIYFKIFPKYIMVVKEGFNEIV
jgi:hypothetical protein